MNILGASSCRCLATPRLSRNRRRASAAAASLASVFILISAHAADVKPEVPDTMLFDFEKQEIFMRHRCPLMQVDLSSIPAGSIILAAKRVVVRANADYDQGRNPETNPSMWVVEPCNRDWVEDECNAYEYAKGKFWREVGGRYYGDDPDFLPLYVAHGPGTGKVNVLEFTEAVRFWTDGRHANHGFMLHGDEYDWMGRAYYREAKEVKNRPAAFVIYAPAEQN